MTLNQMGNDHRLAQIKCQDQHDCEHTDHILIAAELCHHFAALEIPYLCEAFLERPAAAEWLLHQVFQVRLHSPDLEQSLGSESPLDALPCLKKDIDHHISDEHSESQSCLIKHLITCHHHVDNCK